jgi:hypothetical protein
LEHLRDNEEYEFLKEAIHYLEKHEIEIPNYLEEEKKIYSGCPAR